MYDVIWVADNSVQKRTCLDYEQAERFRLTLEGMGYSAACVDASKNLSLIEEDVPEPPEPEDSVSCHECGCRITDAEYDDNGGYCDACAAPDEADRSEGHRVAALGLHE